VPPEDVTTETVNFETKPDQANTDALAKPAEEAVTETPAQTPAEASTEADAEGHEAGDDGQQPEGEKPLHKSGNAWQKRIDKITKDKHEALRRAEEAEAKAELYRQMAEGGTKPKDGGAPAPANPNAQSQPTPPVFGTREYQEAVHQEAARIAEQQAFQSKFQSWEETGKKEYPDFVERCNALAQLGASERPDFVPALLDIDNGAKVAAKLAENPDEAIRILTLPPTKMISELTKMGIEAGKAKPKATSKAPAPFKPIDGTAAVTDEIMPDDSEEEFYRKRAAQMKKRRAARYGS